MREMVERARRFDGRKLLWDGVAYDSEDEARIAVEKYADEGFEVEVWMEQDKAFVYTRRMVKEAAAEQS